ncbi:hypothetical protein RUM44_012634 [Polyplax serrata]|uniref:Odorant receptor n=1 Tax=Polyplax serrata TaxID=468196 RepID=A0ABR1BBU9_POLSC
MVQHEEQVKSSEPSSEDAFYNNFYSEHFNTLRKMGLWSYRGKSKTKKRLYMAYSCGSVAYCCMGFLLATTNLYLLRRNLAEISFNLSTNVLTGAMLIKNFCMIYHCREIEKLRRDLFDDESRQTDSEEIEIRKQYKFTFLAIKHLMQCVSYTIFPIWLTLSLSSLIWEPREMPFSLWIPFNIERNFNFFVIFVIHALIGTYVTVQAVNMELGMFALFIQTVTQYRMLVYQVVKIKKYYLYPVTESGKINCNRVMVENQVKFLLKNYVRRHLVLKRYVRQLELVFNKPMLSQLLFAVVLMVMNGVFIILAHTSLTVKVYYQAAYAMIITVDVFIICTVVTHLFEQKQKIFDAICDLPWYEMDRDIQKQLMIIMIGLQQKEALTAWKIFKIDLTTFTTVKWRLIKASLAVMRAVASWLTLFLQVIKLDA